MIWFKSWTYAVNLHVGGVRIQAADDQTDGGGQQVGDVP